MKTSSMATRPRPKSRPERKSVGLVLTGLAITGTGGPITCYVLVVEHAPQGTNGVSDQDSQRLTRLVGDGVADEHSARLRHDRPCEGVVLAGGRDSVRRRAKRFHRRFPGSFDLILRPSRLSQHIEAATRVGELGKDGKTLPPDPDPEPSIDAGLYAEAERLGRIRQRRDDLLRGAWDPEGAGGYRNGTALCVMVLPWVSRRMARIS